MAAHKVAAHCLRIEVTEGAIMADPEAGWRRDDWVKQLGAAEPRLAALVADGTSGGTVLKLISRVRNSIHGEALRTITLRSSGPPPENPVELGASLATNTVSDIASLRDIPSAWGLREEHGRAYLSVDRYAESLLPHAVYLLNDLMVATAVERFPGVERQALGRSTRIGMARAT